MHAGIEESGTLPSDGTMLTRIPVGQKTFFRQVHYTFNLRDFSKVICGARDLNDPILREGFWGQPMQSIGNGVKMRNNGRFEAYNKYQ